MISVQATQNTRQEDHPTNNKLVFSGNIGFGCQCSRMATWYRWFALLWVIVVGPVFISSEFTTQEETFRLCLACGISQNEYVTFFHFRSYVTWFPCFENIPNDFECVIAFWIFPNVSASSCFVCLHFWYSVTFCNFDVNITVLKLMKSLKTTPPT